MLTLQEEVSKSMWILITLDVSTDISVRQACEMSWHTLV